MSVSYVVQGSEVRLIRDRYVYPPSRVSLLMATHVMVKEGDDVLDIGTGTGFLALTASMLGARRVLGTDISPRALRVARANAQLNRMRNVELILGDVCQPIRGKSFDLIVCNPPMTPSPMRVKVSTWGGYDGRSVLDEVLRGAPAHLALGGRLVIPTISVCGIQETASAFEALGLRYRILCEETYEFSFLMTKLLLHISSLPHSEVIYKKGRPHYSVSVFEARKEAATKTR
ncbi:MAG: HemK2/MTQ2 family protein methyltransferase [Nitrososphaeria archaeon]